MYTIALMLVLGVHREQDSCAGKVHNTRATSTPKMDRVPLIKPRIVDAEIDDSRSPVNGSNITERATSSIDDNEHCTINRSDSEDRVSITRGNLCLDKGIQKLNKTISEVSLDDSFEKEREISKPVHRADAQESKNIELLTEQAFDAKLSMWLHEDDELLKRNLIGSLQSSDKKLNSSSSFVCDDIEGVNEKSKGTKSETSTKSVLSYKSDGTCSERSVISDKTKTETKAEMNEKSNEANSVASISSVCSSGSSANSRKVKATSKDGNSFDVKGDLENKSDGESKSFQSDKRISHDGKSSRLNEDVKEKSEDEKSSRSDKTISSDSHRSCHSSQRNLKGGNHIENSAKADKIMPKDGKPLIPKEDLKDQSDEESRTESSLSIKSNDSKVSSRSSQSQSSKLESNSENSVQKSNDTTKSTASVESDRVHSAGSLPRSSEKHSLELKKSDENKPSIELERSFSEEGNKSGTDAKEEEKSSSSGSTTKKHSSNYSDDFSKESVPASKSVSRGGNVSSHSNKNKIVMPHVERKAADIAKEDDEIGTEEEISEALMSDISDGEDQNSGLLDLNLQQAKKSSGEAKDLEHIILGAASAVETFAKPVLLAEKLPLDVEEPDLVSAGSDETITREKPPAEFDLEDQLVEALEKKSAKDNDESRHTEDASVADDSNNSELERIINSAAASVAEFEPTSATSRTNCNCNLCDGYHEEHCISQNRLDIGGGRQNANRYDVKIDLVADRTTTRLLNDAITAMLVVKRDKTNHGFSDAAIDELNNMVRQSQNSTDMNKSGVRPKHDDKSKTLEVVERPVHSKEEPNSDVARSLLSSLPDINSHDMKSFKDLSSLSSLPAFLTRNAESSQVLQVNEGVFTMINKY